MICLVCLSAVARAQSVRSLSWKGCGRKGRKEVPTPTKEREMRDEDEGEGDTIPMPMGNIMV